MPQPRRQRPSLRAPAIRFQDGGYVPGTGRGDKIPAKYEPGEFVVSNDMIDDNPGLREQLSGLRAETLAARGKTVAEADAKAMTGKGLRAVGGFGPGGEWVGGNRPVQPTTGRNTVDPAERLRSMNQAAKQARFNPPFNPTTSLGAGVPSNGIPYTMPPEPIRATTSPGASAPPPRPAMPPPILDVERLRAAGVPPPTSVPLPPDQAAAYNNSAEGKATSRQYAHEKFAQAGGGKNVPPAAPGAAPAAAAPSTASKLFGSADDWKNALKGPADSPHKTLRMTVPEAPGKFAKGLGVLQGAMGAKNAYDGVQEGDSWKAGVGAADALAGAALLTPAAPAAGAYLGLRGAWDGAKMAGAAISDRLSEGAKDAIGGTVNQIGLNTGLWGVDDSAMMQMDAEQRLRGPAQSPAPPPARSDPRDPYAAANAAKIAAADAQATGAPTPGGYGPIGDRTKLTNEQAAIMNPAGRVTMTRGANGNMEFSGGNVSGQVSYNDAGGKALPGGGLRGKGFSNFDVAPAGANVAMGPGGYAFATSGSGLRGQGAGGQGSAPQTLGGVDVSGLSGEQAVKYATEVRNAQRINASQSALREAASSSGRSDLRSPEYLAARARKMDTARDYNRMSRSEIQARTALTQIEAQQQAAQMQQQTAQRGQDMTAETSRYGADTSFAGTKYGADAQLGAKQMEMQYKLRQQQAIGALWKAADGKPEVFQSLAMQYGLADAAKQGGDMAGAQQTRAKANSEDAQSTFKGLFTDKEGKRDEHAEARAHQLASQVVPGWENMNPEQRNANRAKVVDATRTVQGMNKLRNNGWLQAIGWDAPTPEYSQLPDLDGATVGDVGFLEGAARKAVGKNDTKITLRNGENRFVPAGTLSEAQLRMLQDNGAMRSTR